MSLLWIAFKGFMTAAGLIMAIGAQNAFVLTQGLRGLYLTSIALTCAGIDAVLITAGVLGMGVLIQSSPVILLLVTLGGALFLSAYGAKAAYAAFHAQGMKPSEHGISSRKSAIFTCAALSLLNPHVYLDTVILIGSIGGAFQGLEQVAFTLGACMASLIWFLCLSHGARYLSPYLSSARSWQVLDSLIAMMMFGIAFGLWRHFFTLIAA